MVDVLGPLLNSPCFPPPVLQSSLCDFNHPEDAIFPLAALATMVSATVVSAGRRPGAIYIRMPPRTFDTLLELVRDKIRNTNNWRKAITPEQRLIVTLSSKNPHFASKCHAVKVHTVHIGFPLLPPLVEFPKPADAVPHGREREDTGDRPGQAQEGLMAPPTGQRNSQAGNGTQKVVNEDSEVIDQNGEEAIRDEYEEKTETEEVTGMDIERTDNPGARTKIAFLLGDANAEKLKPVLEEEWRRTERKWEEIYNHVRQERIALFGVVETHLRREEVPLHDQDFVWEGCNRATEDRGGGGIGCLDQNAAMDQKDP
ncbi:hypothetical protein HPB47_026740 [Ixodes persulcatus]|uniref:Uncharacterized protein n=1 Tax=Ixodes persulcatus TaxID=34615 RepID=A0AC60PZC3_IXOPE|nr:hypothetical protein HPB47_026740 [Ixodes persulcatus]